MSARLSPEVLRATRSSLRSFRARMALPRHQRAVLLQLLADAEQCPEIATLERAPAVGAAVKLVTFDSYLHRHHNAVPGSLGSIVGHSHLSHDDRGVFVDWGDGVSVRADLNELALA
ncbi:hypothetical protein OVA26_16015 [Microbacterium sp. SL62]|uniref:hypothetical protein n=1 Tax=Microbacterium sp. SL62 TaxID=2995139 RepID=UPI00227647C1|nr:hypothetical protein [Microbacterium sp. SL62]MCY1718441.1 hypothetical protein [Microbacterium sp. SL62]